MSPLTLHSRQPAEPTGSQSAELGQEQQPQSSLPAEYAGMFLCAHAMFCALVRFPIVGRDQSVVVGIMASLWVASRVVHALRWQWFFPFVAAGFLGLLLWIELIRSGTGQLIYTRGPFSGTAILSMLVLVMGVDGVIAFFRLRHRLQAREIRDRLTALLMQHGLRILLWGTFGFIMAYSIVVPLVQEAIYLQTASATETDPQFAMDRLTLPQKMLFKFSESTTGMWFFVVGSCVGSFLNVVIYRVPAGISVLAKASHCPKCQTKIAGRDNLPLIGWLKLQGQCRNCGTSIASRYPSVELTIGLLFLLLYFVELISGGTNLPGRLPNHYAGALWILFYTKWDLVSLYVFHCYVLCAVFSWIMIGRDGHRVPTKAVIITIGIVTGAALIWPHLLPWSADGLLPPEMHITNLPPVASAAIRLLSGAAVGISVGWLVSRYCCFPFQPGTWLMIGIAFGWQSAVSISVLCVGAKLLLRMATIFSTVERRAAASDGSVASIQQVHTHSGVRDKQAHGANSWRWLLPIVLLTHHCLWRQLVLVTGGAS